MNAEIVGWTMEMGWMQMLDSAVVAWHLRAAVALSVVLLAGLALRGCSERTRHRMLAWGMLAAVALPTAAALAPEAWGVPIGTRAQIEAVDAAPALATPLPYLAGAAGEATVAALPVTPTLDVGMMLLAVWAAGAAVCFAGVAAAAVGSLSLRKGASAVSPTTRALFEALQIQARTSARLGVTPKVRGPIVVGALGPTVLLPREAIGWSEVRLRAVLAHELGHVAQGDHRWFPIAYAVRGLLWFNPLAWLVSRALFRAAEFSADEAAVCAQMNAPSYAAQLLSLASSGMCERAPMLAAGALGRPDVGTRIRRLLRGPHTAAGMRRVVPVALGLLGALTCIVLAKPAAVMPTGGDEVIADATEASNLLAVPDAANRISLRRGGIAIRDKDGDTIWSDGRLSQAERRGHLIVGLHDFLVTHADPTLPLVVDADRSLGFAALVDAIYTAGRAGITNYYLTVPTENGPRALAIFPPRFPDDASTQGQPALRVGVIVGEHAVRLGSRPSHATPPRYEDPLLSCVVPMRQSVLRDAARRLCAATDGESVEMTYSAPEGTSYGALTDTIIATVPPCGGAQLIEAGAELEEPRGGPDCADVLADFRHTAAR